MNKVQLYVLSILVAMVLVGSAQAASPRVPSSGYREIAPGHYSVDRGNAYYLLGSVVVRPTHIPMTRPSSRVSRRGSSASRRASLEKATDRRQASLQRVGTQRRTAADTEVSQQRAALESLLRGYGGQVARVGRLNVYGTPQGTFERTRPVNKPDLRVGRAAVTRPSPATVGEQAPAMRRAGLDRSVERRQKSLEVERVRSDASTRRGSLSDAVAQRKQALEVTRRVDTSLRTLGPSPNFRNRNTVMYQQWMARYTPRPR